MDDSGDDNGLNWYEEPITIVGFVAGFLLLILVIASVLILCYSREDEEDQGERGQEGQPRNEDSREEQGGTQVIQHDKTNPLYISANEFDLHPLPSSIRANFVQIHVDEKASREGFRAYYNTEN